MLQFEKINISNIVISTAFGFGSGLPIYKWWKPYKSVMATANRTGTTILTKSFTLDPIQGNFNIWNPLTWKHIQRLPDGGLYNNYGLTNPGYYKVMLEMKGVGGNVLPNIWVTTFHDLVQIVTFMKPSAIELNFSCPNAWSSLEYPHLIESIKNIYPDLILIVKIGVLTPMDTIKRMIDMGIHVIHATNSVPISYFKVCDNSPYAKFKDGAVSGKPIRHITFKFNEKLRKVTTLPIIMGGGVSSHSDIKDLKAIGADCISICSLAVLEPELTCDIISEYNCA